jgi:hypothetical protein
MSWRVFRVTNEFRSIPFKVLEARPQLSRMQSAKHKPT